MQRVLILILFPVILQSCSALNKGPINSKNIKEIIMLVNDPMNAKDSNKITIKDLPSLVLLLQKINDCKPIPLDFYPTHKLKLSYATGVEKMVFCSGSSMRYKGHTYEMTESIRDIILSLRL